VRPSSTPEVDLEPHDAGPAIAWLFLRLWGLSLVCAWVSLAVQVQVLLGRRGLLPVGDFLDRVDAHPDLGFWDLPTWLWLEHSDTTIIAGAWVGAALALCVTLGWLWRPALLLSAVLYLGYIHAGQDFLSFQWDNLLVEVSVLAAFLRVSPGGGTDWWRSGRWVHLSLRLVLFKVFFESGLSKWLSAAHDWQDGSAMSLYYQTAPLPTWPAWYAHHLPASWHTIESWWTLFFELFVPFLLFGPRRARQVALVVFGGFILVDGATANYGFFLPMTAALLVLGLDEADVRWLRRSSRADGAAAPPQTRMLVLALLVGLPHLALSALDGLDRFGGVSVLEGARDAVRPLRLSNVYHLFGTITTARIEPEFQVKEADGSWLALELHHKPGDPLRAPGFVAPHQPRVDFQLWFYGLHFQQRTDGWVRNLVERLCTTPDAVQPLFRTPLPSHPDAVRLVFYAYRYSPAVEREATGAWWVREEVERSPELECAR
jgi:lipase maturation factor 1